MLMSGCRGDDKTCAAQAFALINPDRPYYEGLAAEAAARHERQLAAILGSVREWDSGLSVQDSGFGVQKQVSRAWGVL
jgi:hypothetical protein